MKKKLLKIALNSEGQKKEKQIEKQENERHERHLDGHKLEKKEKK